MQRFHGPDRIVIEFSGRYWLSRPHTQSLVPVWTSVRGDPVPRTVSLGNSSPGGKFLFTCLIKVLGFSSSEMENKNDLLSKGIIVLGNKNMGQEDPI